MSRLSRKLFDLSPKRRALLGLLLQEEGVEYAPTEGAGLAPTPRIPARKGTDPVSTSFSQQRLWFLDQLVPGNPAYNIPLAICLNGPLDVAVLEQSLNEIVHRHETLRTTFASTDGRPLQVIAPSLRIQMPLVDLRCVATTAREDEARRLAVREAQQPFDLSRGPLMRATLLRLQVEEVVLLLTMHHIASDGWSMGNLIRETAALYEVFSKGEPSPLPPLPIQYADFAAWQREWLQGKVLETHLSYWKEQLDGAPVALELPSDRPRPPIQAYRGAMQSFTLSTVLTKALKALSQQEGVTLFMTMLAAFKMLLYTHTGQEDIVVGSPTANRNRSEIEGLIGFFVNTLALRTDLSGDPSFRELLKRVREATLGAYAHQELPFEVLVEELRPKRVLSHTPLFQVMFALQSGPLNVQELPGLTLKPFQVDYGTAQFDLILSMREADRRLVGSFEYSLDLFNATTIARLARHFQALLRDVTENPERRLSDLPLMTKAEWHQLLVEWNDTEVETPEDPCMDELFEAQVDRTPDAVAVVFEGQHVTYRELGRRANQLAHYLQRLGVGPEDLVGVCMERSLEMVVGLLGVLKAGGAYVPLDPAYPSARLAFMMGDAQVPVLLTCEGQLSTLRAEPQGKALDFQPSTRDARVICLDAEWASICQQEAEKLNSGVRGDNLAYVIYTSGSTGEPKGAMNTHGGIGNRLSWMQDAYQLSGMDRVIQKTPFSFDVSVWEFFWPLMTGACLVVARPEGHKDSAYLVRTVIEQGITTMHFVPSMLQVFVGERGVEGCSSLRRVICSGEALSSSLQERLFARVGAELHNLYGPTEAAIDVTFWPCEGGGRGVWECGGMERTVPIGRPIANTRVYLLDRDLKPVPVGVAGELHIGGVGLARGYHNRSGLTGERFIPDPLSEKPGARLYKTGDLCRYLPDGKIEFLGRIDYQVKVRGFRIELGEIEAVLKGHPGLREAVVLAWEDVAADRRLVAYVVPARRGDPRLRTRNSKLATQNSQLATQDSPTVAELRDFLREKLPEYMVPSAFLTLDELPLMPNGKVDRRALPPPDGTRPETTSVFVAPRTPTEEMLVAIWARVLGIERVGVHDDFFELGGHSLLVTQVVSRVHQTFQVDLPVHTLFGVPTVAGLAEIIEHKRTESETVEMRRILEKVRALSEEEASKELRMRREDKTWEEVPCPNKHAEQ